MLETQDQRKPHQVDETEHDMRPSGVARLLDNRCVQAARLGRRTRTLAEPRDELTSARNVVCGRPKSGPPQLSEAPSIAQVDGALVFPIVSKIPERAHPASRFEHPAVRCPLIRMTTDSGTPTLFARVMKIRRRSWNQRPGSSALPSPTR